MCVVRDIQVTTGVNFGLRGNPTKTVQYSYFIDDHGPFVDTFPEGADTPEAVKAAQQARVDKLRAAGVFHNTTY